jgi:hypothetical protein
MAISIVKPKIVSSGLSVCRTNDGHIVVSVHEDKQHILLELSEQECFSSARDLLTFCEQGKQVT